VEKMLSVYLNQFDELVIRQEGQPYQGEDVWVVIAPANVSRVIAAMQEMMGFVLPTTATKDTTAASRQRRHRDRHRDDGAGIAPVTVDGAVTGRAADGDGDTSLGQLALIAAE
jgi:hypothetical protein